MDIKHFLRQFVGLSLCLLPLSAFAGLTAGGVTWGKEFVPDTIGPGSTTMLVFTINNTGMSPADDLSFTDTLPAGVVIATPAAVVNDCDGSVNAPDGGTTITLGGGKIGASSSCTISVNVTAGSPGSYLNTSGDLTHSQGNSGPASATLTVASDRPGFVKIFGDDPFSPCFGDGPMDGPFVRIEGDAQPGKSANLQLLIDNSCNDSSEFFLSFTDNLPTGMLVADPPNLVNDCGGGATADPGATSISLSGGTVGAASICSISVDVVTDTAGRFENVTSELSFGSPANSSGKAGDVLEVVQPVFSKSFLDDPVAAGDIVVLEFTINNLDRDFTMTNLAFSDDLDATLSGLEAIGANANECGGMASGFPTGVFDYAGGSLAPGDSCTISISLQVPAGASPGNYPNTTSDLTGTRNGDGFTEGPASDVLNISPLSLAKSISPDPVASGDVLTLEFTITNSDTTNTADDVSFVDNLTAFMNGATIDSLPASGFCGTGSTASAFVSLDDLFLTISNASLGTGASCTFQVQINVPPEIASGLYTNKTSRVTGDVGGVSVVGNVGMDDVTVVGAPTLQKEFIGDPAQPGGAVDLQFRLFHDEFAPGPASDIAFTDNLDDTLPGLVATGLPLNDICGSGSQIDGTGLLTFTGGLLNPGDTCVFDVPLQVPGSATSGSFLNTTSDVTALVDGLNVTGAPATADLMVSGLQFVKEFTDDPVIPGGQVTLQFTITNLDESSGVTGLQFTDDLDDVISGLAATGLPLNDICGTGSSLTGSAGDTFLTFSGGSLGPATGESGTSCSFSVTLDVPAGAADDTYNNVTSALSSSQGTAPPATDQLLVDSDLLVLQKEFTDDPVVPGGVVTLQFTITTQDEDSPASDIAFTDDLTDGLTVSGSPTSDCGGTLTAPDAGTSIALTDGTLTAGGECTITVSVDVPAGTPVDPPIENVTSQITGTINGLSVAGDPGIDTLLLRLLTFSKAFIDDPADAGGTVTLSFTLQNESATDTVSGIGFTDDLDAVTTGLAATNTPRNDVCGTGSSLTGTSVLVFQNGELGPGENCSFTVTLAVPTDARGDLPNTTSAATVSGIEVAPPATDTLTVLDPPTVSFTLDAASLPESAGGPATVVGVELSRATSLPVTVPFTIGGTATQSADFTIATTSPITIPAGATTAPVTASILEDTLVEGDETVIVTMGMPTNATPGAITVFTGTILDNDVVKEAAAGDDDDGGDSCDTLGEYLLLCITATGPEDFVLLIPLALIGLWRQLKQRRSTAS